MLIKGEPQSSQNDLIVKVVKEFSTDEHYEFASKYVFSHKLNFKDFPELHKIVCSRHELIDRAFMDVSNAKHIPINVLECLISEN